MNEWPQYPPAWLVPWAIWRLSGQKGDRPVAPEKIPSWAWEFLRWAIWRRSGGLPNQRPAALYEKVPLWAWGLLKQINFAINQPHGQVMGLPILQRPTLYVCWGLTNGQFNPQTLVAHARMNGFTAIALQATEPKNIQAFPSVQALGREVDVMTGLWEWGTTVESAIGNVDAVGAPDFLDINVEHLGDWGSFFYALRREFPMLPIATSTNFWGFITPENLTTFDGAAKPVVAMGVACRPEAYLADSPTSTPERLHYTARRLGWPHEMILPLVSLYTGAHGKYGLSDYDLTPYAGWGAYTAEYL